MKSFIFAAIAALAISTSAQAANPNIWWKCVTGTEPAQWDIDGTCPNTRSRDIPPVGSSGSHKLTDWDYGGYHYHDNGGSNFTVTGPGGTYDYQYHPDGSFTVTH